MTALLLLLLCFLLFTLIERYRGAMLTLEKLTYLYEHLPMRFDLRIQPGERRGARPQRRR